VSPRKARFPPSRRSGEAPMNACSGRVNPVSGSQRNVCFGAPSSPSRGGWCRGAIRPIEPLACSPGKSTAQPRFRSSLRTPQFDPKATFKVVPVNGRYAPDSGRRLNAARLPQHTLRTGPIGSRSGRVQGTDAKIVWAQSEGWGVRRSVPSPDAIEIDIGRYFLHTRLSISTRRAFGAARTHERF
jgi:hypothetical protein